MQDRKLYWGDSRTNIHARQVGRLEQPPADARSAPGFRPIAYYPMHGFE